MHLTDREEVVSALGRGLSLIDIIAAANSPLSHGEVVRLSNLPKATVTRLLSTLVMHDYVQYLESTDTFKLGAKVLYLGNAYLKSFDFRNVLRIQLTALSDRIQAAIHIGIQDDLDMLVIDTIRPRLPLIQSRADIGDRMEIPTSAIGRAYFSSLNIEDRLKIIDKLQLAYPSRSIDLKTRLLESLDQYHNEGYCTSFGEWHSDINAVGFYATEPRGLTYGISIGGPAFKLTKDWFATTGIPEIIKTKQSIYREIGEEE